jgi:hypothetical protein
MSIPLDVKIEFGRRLTDEELDEFRFPNKMDEIEFSEIKVGDIFTSPRCASLYFYVSAIIPAKRPRRVNGMAFPGVDMMEVRPVTGCDKLVIKTSTVDDLIKQEVLFDFDYLALGLSIKIPFYKDDPYMNIDSKVFRATNNFVLTRWLNTWEDPKKW